MLRVLKYPLNFEHGNIVENKIPAWGTPLSIQIQNNIPVLYVLGNPLDPTQQCTRTILRSITNEPIDKDMEFFDYLGTVNETHFFISNY